MPSHQAPHRPSSRRQALAVAVVVLVAATGSGCSGSDDEPAGPRSGRAVVEAHVRAMERYDLEAACNLLTPDRRAEMADFDGTEVEGYCAGATAEVLARATDEVKADTALHYADAEITTLDRADGTWFAVDAADGSYHEEVEVVEIDGRWWVAQVDGQVLDEDGHEH